ncbi:hypothetical protein CXG81DRAFT_11007 [Caulochytrium protostelioides]|uniref:Homoserine dehydrogenase n=1 Tax=Caulochytrium protostelioides TaxID=1555241 RepID=A0A4P9XA51_9FUNG|nr:hypothetical protein CXG81DRAFT_11007 [Caulochytrium protostelioides]|eukprot:RKP02247.1 hypothetical protein CXG81DRAFT_11007 [Caulochytrium protostelioides]
MLLGAQPTIDPQIRHRLQTADGTVVVARDLNRFTTFCHEQRDRYAGLVIVDATADAEVASRYPAWLAAGIHIVTPNKKAFAGDLTLWEAMHDATRVAQAAGRPSHVLHESTVGAGLPVLSTLNDLLATGDEVHTIEGIFSGTLSYLFNRYSTVAGDAPPFSEIVATARQLGYTEPDARDDLSGADVARKVVILARVCGLHLSLADFTVENLVPAALQDASIDAHAFLTRLAESDAAMAARQAAARQAGQVLRYVGHVDVAARTARVSLAAYPASHPFASLQGSDNMVAFTTRRFPQPLTIQGAGAGAAVTAFGMMADLLRLQRSVVRC